MIQRTFERVRRIELKLGVEPSHYEPGGSSGQATPAERVDDPPADGGEASPASEREGVPS
jgi:hypothetical protein